MARIVDGKKQTHPCHKRKKKCDVEGPHYLKKLGIRGGRGQNVNPFKRWGRKINVGDFIFKKKLQIMELFV